MPKSHIPATGKTFLGVPAEFLLILGAFCKVGDDALTPRRKNRPKVGDNDHTFC